MPWKIQVGRPSVARREGDGRVAFFLGWSRTCLIQNTWSIYLYIYIYNLWYHFVHIKSMIILSFGFAWLVFGGFQGLIFFIVNLQIQSWTFVVQAATSWSRSMGTGFRRALIKNILCTSPVDKDCKTHPRYVGKVPFSELAWNSGRLKGCGLKERNPRVLTQVWFKSMKFEASY